MLISYTLDAGSNRHNLDTLSEIHLNHKTISYKELVGTGKNKLNFSDIALDKATEYAAEDADVTLRLYNHLKARLDEEKLNKVYETFEKPMIKLLSNSELILEKTLRLNFAVTPCESLYARSNTVLSFARSKPIKNKSSFFMEEFNFCKNFSPCS